MLKKLKKSYLFFFSALLSLALVSQLLLHPMVGATGDTAANNPITSEETASSEENVDPSEVINETLPTETDIETEPVADPDSETVVEEQEPSEITEEQSTETLASETEASTSESTVAENELPYSEEALAVVESVQQDFFAMMAAAMMIEPASFASGDSIANAVDLKAAIEAATTDSVFYLEAGIFDFVMDGTTSPQIVNNNGVKITLIGAQDAEGKPATFFTMAADVPGSNRFLRLPSGTLEVSNISFTGTPGVNGGITAQNVVAQNTIFTNNFNNGDQSVSGGGAIRASRDLWVENSTFIKNSAGAAADGGAISVEYGGNFYVNNSVFDQNERGSNQNQYGGAISIKQPGVAGTTITITNSSFTNNINRSGGSWGRGGAIHILANDKITNIKIDNVLFKGNSNPLNNGGALAFMAVAANTSVRVTNSTFLSNSASKYGGAVYMENCVSDDFIIANSTFMDNTSSYFINAGKTLGAYSSKVKLDSVTIIGSTTNNSSDMTISTPGTNSKVTITHSLLSNVNVFATATIVYSGTNLARTSSADPVLNKEDIFSAYTVDTLVAVNSHNYVAPILPEGPAYEAITEARSFPVAQNGLERKSPASDAGGYEAPVPIVYYQVNFYDQGNLYFEETVEEGTKAYAPVMPRMEGYTFIGWSRTASAQDLWDFDATDITENVDLYAVWEEIIIPTTVPTTEPTTTEETTVPSSSETTTDTSATEETTSATSSGEVKGETRPTTAETSADSEVLGTNRELTKTGEVSNIILSTLAIVLAGAAAAIIIVVVQKKRKAEKQD